MIRTTSRSLFALAGVLLFAACNDNTTTGINGDASGTYNLALINNAQPPAIIFQDLTIPETLTLTGGNFIINSDGTFSETLNIDDTTSSGTTSSSSTCPGTFSQNGGNFTFSETNSGDPNCGATYSGSWDGSNSFSFAFGNQILLVFSKAATP
jgi:hypothetical protein